MQLSDSFRALHESNSIERERVIIIMLCSNHCFLHFAGIKIVVHTIHISVYIAEVEHSARRLLQVGGHGS